MRLKIFCAPDTASALAQIRKDLGSDALIVSTRRVRDGVEVTAALETADTGAPPPPDRRPALAWHGTPPLLAEELCGRPLDEALGTTLAFGPALLSCPPQRLIVQGPVGNGKTLTVARLATQFVMAGQVPMVITADTQTAGGTERLAAFTRVLGVPLTVAGTPELLCRALLARQNQQPVLIDAPGLDVLDPSERAFCADLCSAAQASVALVLAAGTDPGEAADIAAGFKALGADRLIPTRLDVGRRLGGVLAAAASGLVLSDAGMGSGAADGLRPFTPLDLATCIIERHAARSNNAMRHS